MNRVINPKRCDDEDLISIPDASAWASGFLNKDVTNSNISYLIQYALIRKFDFGGTLKVSLSDLKQYYEIHRQNNIEATRYRSGQATFIPFECTAEFPVLSIH